ncbi:hypothetical protein LOTGIDRAFT_157972 [Lottia gigantea]|uniref:PKD domain-containing protein n=1 Tax=Lottia gigantea TaxID=225164 RepID=V4ATQ6_LOTGI|nr:hypothetical protein LOTGIDRAFT_157972 [Lottia gigantea]ESP00683.1 hypothetical protein LOTGIDRAFT_157972 [Lottia gigantea]
MWRNWLIALISTGLYYEICTGAGYLDLQPSNLTVAQNTEVPFKLNSSISSETNCTIYFGDGSSLDLYRESGDQNPIPFTKLFTTVGNQSVTATCDDFPFNVVSYILVKTYTINDFNLLYTSPFSVNYTVYGDVPFTILLSDIEAVPSNVQLSWDFGDGIIEDTVLTDWITVHRYATRGLYVGQLSITALGSERIYTFEQQVGVIKLSVNKDVDFVNTAISFTIAFVTPLSDNPTTLPITLDYGDGETIAITTEAIPTKNHYYPLDDYYYPLVTGENGSFIEHVALPNPLIIENDINNKLQPAFDGNINFPPGDLSFQMNVPAGTPRLYYMKCSFRFGDDIDKGLHIFIHNQTVNNPLIFEYHYRTLGQHRVHWKCEKKLTSQAGNFLVKVINNCVTKNGVFDRQYSNHTRPLGLYTSDVQEITSRLTVVCINQGPYYLWSMYKLRNITSEPFPNPDEWEEVYPIQQPGGDSIQFPIGSIPRGWYRLNFRVSFTTHTRYFEESTYIAFLEPPLRADIVGGFTVTGGYYEHEINGFEQSYDPLIEIGNEDPDIEFSWQCSRVASSTFNELQAIYHNESISVPCSNITTAAGRGILSFDASALTSPEGFVFVLTVTKPDRNSDTFTQLFQVEGGTPKIDIKCIINCEIKTAVSSDLSLVVYCPSCLETDLLEAQYTWNMVHLVPEESTEQANFSVVENFEENVIDTGENPSTFVLKKGFIEPGKVYLISVEVILPGFETPGFSSFRVVTNLPPYGGTCTVDPTSGVATQTKFRVFCDNWKDEGYRNGYNPVLDKHEPFTFKYLIGKENHLVPLMAGGESTSPEMDLPLFPELNGTDYSIIIRVFDILQDYTEVTLNITLTSPLASMPNVSGAEKVDDLISAKSTDLSEASGTSSTVRFSRTVNSVVAAVQSVPLPQDPLLIDATGGISQVQPDWLELWNDFKRPRDLTTQKAVAEKGQDFVAVMKGRKESFTDLNGQGVTIVSECLTNIMANPESTTLDTALQGADVTFSASDRLNGLLNKRPFPVKEKIDEVVNGMTGMMDKVINAVTPDLEGKVAEITTASVRELVSQTGIGGSEVSPNEAAFIAQRIATIQNLEVEKKKNASRQLISGMEDSLERSHDALTKSLVSGQAPKTIERGNIVLRAQKLSPNELARQDIKAGDFTLNLPAANTTGGLNRSEPVDIQATVFKKNPFSWGSNGTSYGIDSPIVSLKLKAPNGTVANKMPISLKLKTKSPPKYQTFNVNETLKGPYGMHYHTFLLRDTADYSFMVIKASNETTNVKAYFRVDKTPKLKHYDYKINVAAEEVNGERIFKLLVPAHTLKKGKVVVGLLFDEEEPDPDDPEANSRRRRSVSFNEKGVNETTTSYNLVAGTDGCKVWIREREYWDDTSCKVSPYSTPEETICDCEDPPALTFGSSFYSPPNTIDFSTVFEKFDISNASVYGTVLAILLVYILLLLWARRADKRDYRKWQVGYLKDNHKDDEYFYLLTVETGLRKHSGTRSNVYFILSSQKADSGVRVLSDGERHLETGSVMTFIMTSDIQLDELQFLRIWHDNSGEYSADWLFNKMIVEDLETRKRSIFVCNRWLSVGKDDGLIDRIVPISAKKDLTFTHLFSEHARNNATDSHLWLSVVFRPNRSTFTRAQRVSCCICILFLTMITSAMFFRSSNVDTDEETVKDELVLGPLRFSAYTIWVSFVSILITVPPSMVIVYLFRYSRPRRRKSKTSKTKNMIIPEYTADSKEGNGLDLKPVDSEETEVEEISLNSGSGVDKDIGDVDKAEKGELDQSELIRDADKSNKRDNLNEVLESLEKNVLDEMDQEKPLPFWCLYISWILLTVTILVCGFLLILYSMQWGKSVSEEWVTSFFLSFFENIFLTDPLKIAVFAIVFSVLMKSPYSKQDKLDVEIVKDGARKNIKFDQGGQLKPPEPLPEDVLVRARRRQEQETHAYSVLIEIVIYTGFIIALCVIAYGTRDPLSYNFTEHIKTHLYTNRFDKIQNRTHFMAWTEKNLFPFAFATYDFNGDVLDWRRKLYFFDLVSFRVGPVRIRQIRIKDRPPPDNDNFFGDRFYNLLDNRTYYGSLSPEYEETGEYCLYWKPKPCSLEEISSAQTSPSWVYTSSNQDWGLPLIGKISLYGASGYFFDMDINYDSSVAMFTELYNNLWIDRQTRAVSVEFSLFNADANLLMVVQLIAEFPEYGSAVTWHHINAIRIFQHVTSMGIMVIVCEIIVAIVMIVTLVKAIKSIVKQRCQYFQDFWHIMDILTVIITLFGVIIFILKEVFLEQTLSLFREDPKSFVNFEHIVWFDSMFLYALAFLLFFTTIGMMRVLGYNKKITIIALVLKRSAKNLGSFGVLFILMFFGFISSGYILFHSNIAEFKTLYDALFTCFTYLLGKNHLQQMLVVAPILGALFFSLFVFYVIFILLTMFQAILNSGITTVRNEVCSEEQPYGVVDVLMNMYRGLIVDFIPEKLKKSQSENEKDKKGKKKKQKPDYNNHAQGDADAENVSIDANTSPACAETATTTYDNRSKIDASKDPKDANSTPKDVDIVNDPKENTEESSNDGRSTVEDNTIDLNTEDQNSKLNINHHTLETEK